VMKCIKGKNFMLMDTTHLLIIFHKNALNQHVLNIDL
jgi:hypothetical protein